MNSLIDVLHLFNIKDMTIYKVDLVDSWTIAFM